MLSLPFSPLPSSTRLHSPIPAWSFSPCCPCRTALARQGAEWSWGKCSVHPGSYLLLTNHPLALCRFTASPCLPKLWQHPLSPVLLLSGPRSWQLRVSLKTGKLRDWEDIEMFSLDNGVFWVTALKHESSVLPRARELSYKVKLLKIQQKSQSWTETSFHV